MRKTLTLIGFLALLLQSNGTWAEGVIRNPNAPLIQIAAQDAAADDDEEMTDESEDDEWVDEEEEEEEPVAAPAAKTTNPAANAASPVVKTETTTTVKTETPATAPAVSVPAITTPTTTNGATTSSPSITKNGTSSISDVNQEIQALSAREKKVELLSARYSKSKEDIEAFLDLYQSQLSKINPEDPKSLAEIDKLVEIVGVSKSIPQSKTPTLKKAPKTDPIVNFSARNIPIRDAFATLARISGKSITVSGQIQDRDSISVVEINDQPFTKAFLSLSEASGVDFVMSGDTYTIVKRQGNAGTNLMTDGDTSEIDMTLPVDKRVADLAYDNKDLGSVLKDLANKYGIDLVMTSTPTERVTIRVRGVNPEQAMTLVTAGTQTSFTRKDDAFVIYSSSNKNFSLDRKTVLFPIKYVEATEVSKLLPTTLASLVKVSENQNALIVEGNKLELTQVYDFLRTIDRPLPQVELDVKLVEVSKKSSYAREFLASQFTLGRLGKTIASTITGTNANGDPATIDNPLTKIIGSGVGQGLNSKLTKNNAFIFKNRPSYKQGSSSDQIKVSQRLLVTSGKNAKINFDEDVNVVLGSGDPAGGGSGGGGVVQNQRIQRVTAGNSMSITPVVGAGGVVTVKVEVEVSVNGEVNDQGVPKSTLRRRLSSEIQISNNETIAIGGLFNDQNNIGQTGELPLLSKLPVIGQFFANRTKSKDQRELLVLITPHIKTPQDNQSEQVFIQAGGY